ncbi:MAG: hypothetical protein Kow00133_01800 [Amphiplicatus sp.]
MRKACRAAPLAAVLAIVAAAGARAGDDALPEIDHVSCTGAANELRVTVQGVERSVGLMTVELYRNDPENFLKKAGRELRVRVAARAPATQLCVHAPQPGDYALAVYHDENANRKLDKKMFGLPAEPYGISNNPRMRFGPPDVEEALFHVAADGAAVEIELKN